MKALIIAGPKKLDVIEIEKPEQDGEHVIIEVHYVGLCGSDVSMWALGGFAPNIVLGHEYAGVVVDPGPRSDLKKGDLVTGLPQNYCRDCYFCNKGDTHMCPETPKKGGPGVTRQGACSPYFAIRSDMACKVSNKLDAKIAALTEPVANSCHAVRLGNVQKGDNILIIGGGIIGIGVAWWCKQSGAGSITIAETNAARAEHLKKHNIGDKIINFQEEGVLESVKEKIGHGFDVIFECSHPSAELFNNILVPLVRKTGTIVQTGAIVGTIGIDFYPFLKNEIRWQTGYAFTEKDFKDSIKVLEENSTDFALNITRTIAMEEAQGVFDELISGQSKDVKIMIDPRL